jgi:hypothetical protein
MTAAKKCGKLFMTQPVLVPHTVTLTLQLEYRQLLLSLQSFKASSSSIEWACYHFISYASMGHPTCFPVIMQTSGLSLLLYERYLLRQYKIDMFKCSKPLEPKGFRRWCITQLLRLFWTSSIFRNSK